MRLMPPREHSAKPRQKKRSHGWVWLVLLVLIAIGGAAYWYWPHFSERFYPPGGTMELVGLRSICAANVPYQYSHPKIGYARTLEDLGPRDGTYIDSELASGKKGGHRFTYVARPGANGLIDTYQVSVRPEKYGLNGKRSLYMDESCDVHYTKEDRAATSSDPLLQ